LGLDLFNFGFLDFFRNHVFDLLNNRCLASDFNRRGLNNGNINNCLRHLFLDNLNSGHFYDRYLDCGHLNYWHLFHWLNFNDSFRLDLDFRLLRNRSDHLRLDHKLLLDLNDGDLDKLLGAGGIEGANILITANADIVSFSIAI
jgi:hypothetical protein